MIDNDHDPVAICRQPLLAVGKENRKNPQLGRNPQHQRRNVENYQHRLQKVIVTDRRAASHRPKDRCRPPRQRLHRRRRLRHRRRSRCIIKAGLVPCPSD